MYTDLHNLIRKYLILPYLTGSFHPSFIEEYGVGLLMDLEKQDGVIHPIPSTYDNFIQTAGIRDGVSYCVKISVFYDNLDVSDPNDPNGIIKIDVSNVFNTTDCVFSLTMISGHTSWDYTCGFK